MADEYEVELRDKLTKEDVRKLTAVLNVPHGLAETMEDPVDFVTRIDSWENFNHDDLIVALRGVGRSDLCGTAREVKMYKNFHQRKKTPMGELFDLLRKDIKKDDWKLIARGPGFEPFKGAVESDYDKMLESCIENGTITKDLITFEDRLKNLKRKDLLERLSALRNKFKSMSRDEFAKLFRDWIKNKIEIPETEMWKQFLEQYMVSQYSKVESILGEDEISLKDIYIPLTVLEQKPDFLSVEDESTENELDFLEKFYTTKKGKQRNRKYHKRPLQKIQKKWTLSIS